MVGCGSHQVTPGSPALAPPPHVSAPAKLAFSWEWCPHDVDSLIRMSWIWPSLKLASDGNAEVWE